MLLSQRNMRFILGFSLLKLKRKCYRPSLTVPERKADRATSKGATQLGPGELRREG